MPWIRRAATPPRHDCRPPRRSLPGHVTEPDGAPGDLWKCDDCRRLWRVALACDWCDACSGAAPHPGVHTVGLTWRRATFWQEFLHSYRLRDRRPDTKEEA